MSRQFLSIISLLFITFYCQAQFVCTIPSTKAFEDKLTTLNQLPLQGLTSNEKAISIAKTFVGEPYLEKTLEINEKREDLVINYLGFDCTTFVESVVALTKLYSGEDNEKFRNLNHYASILEYLRYRDGRRNGYPSRLHYFTEWIRNNQKKGIVTDVTEKIGGTVYDKKINFMSTHITAYKQLVGNDSALVEIKKIEDQINTKPLSQIYIKEIAEIESKIESGDIIALVCKVDGLDVSHVGFAVRLEDNRIHLLHASQSGGKVEITKKPLAEWLKNSKLNTGITVARIN
ncbi:N-acetylmuramoyl-L-alanine amidase-like domain-containing protein [Flammeovirga sp. SubArs3]|uniref:N-acetylmuramoyl-L-alanine amidase-like domain-containing protein n=1 Tax=Flammeovirga sp. SubArs3 TaxID=2995316 RepID=UPI00248D116A|nr:N-acetylmuramoyl-L-alanine amidase-like domain-containing protein [Flammeovirga sp. SubArs3]